MKILVSACLLGTACRYDGESRPCEAVLALAKEHTLIPVCPEILGGLATPRLPSERVGERVMRCDGEDVTEAYQKGAQEVLRLARILDVRTAILKEKSPACGCGKIYDGTFSRTLTDGNGVLSALLIENGIRVMGETEIAEKWQTSSAK